jgi:hypothetical protein
MIRFRDGGDIATVAGQKHPRASWTVIEGAIVCEIGRTRKITIVGVMIHIFAGVRGALGKMGPIMRPTIWGGAPAIMATSNATMNLGHRSHSIMLDGWRTCGSLNP